MKSFAHVYNDEVRPIRYHHPLNESLPCLSQCEQEIEGRLIKASKFVFDDPLHRYDGMKAEDFALENLLVLNVPLASHMLSKSLSEIDNEISKTL